MSGITPDVLFTVSRMLVTFRDEIGISKSIVGTGFWVVGHNSKSFVTNRHNVDPTLKLGSATTMRLAEAQIELRLQNVPGNWRPDREYVRVENIGSCLATHASADVAVLRGPVLNRSNSNFTHGAFLDNYLATQEFLQNSVNPMDIASFVGFPGKDGKDWTDREWGLPIARTGHISSWPRLAFTNDSIPTTDAMVISGLSFSGSSGSPVISHEKGIRVGPPLTGGGHVPPKVIGIMSGHWWDEESSHAMFFHSGLSYLTRATAIRELLDA